MKKLLLASTSTLHNEDYLQYLLKPLSQFFKNKKEVLFLPFARPGGITHETYTEKAKKAFEEIHINVKGLHEYNDMKKAVENAEAIFTGGGNTFLLVRELYKHDLFPVLKEAINRGTPYLGTSAGTNIAGLTMQTTNDMPIIYPPSFKTLGVVPFNINPHYLDPDPSSTHKGETRETRIKEFHTINTQPVIGLREGSWLEIEADKITLKGNPSARIFKAEQLPYEVETETSLEELA